MVAKFRARIMHKSGVGIGYLEKKKMYLKSHAEIAEQEEIFRGQIAKRKKVDKSKVFIDTDIRPDRRKKK